MNKRIFSLVFIALYSLLPVLIHCSEQKAYDAGNKSVHDTKEISRSNEKHDTELKRETQLKNYNPKNDENDEDDKGFNCFNIFKRNKKSKTAKEYSCNKVTGTFLSNDKHLFMDPSEIEKQIQDIFANDPENSKTLLQVVKRLQKQHPNLKHTK
ncbi:Plasmodium yoelii subtelomeric region (PYST-C1), putative [Plasmodium chabaudi adami]|uniref:Plasmodium yoelii subtelomeric region (PYST-C1), putative n=1 Tax=Plasmodium chabaudi adami TaxID=5826 RepID=A0A1D3LAE7_PLACE|nr:Plasmodium yoelii subtelomeric region (PYST-C1), putative [Plasmodium chabaudi adami]